MAIRDEDNKIVSISFNNKQFLDDVQVTIKALEQLNDATSGKNLKSDGILNLQTAFSSLNRSAISNIDGINNNLRDGSAYEVLSENIGQASTKFNALHEIASGIFRQIGVEAVKAGEKIFNGLTSGIRSGWGEYNLLMDSTQTILANTQKYGTTMSDVTAALDELNTYADKTIYNFSQMTRNIGYFTTAGQSLEDSVTAIRGMSNLGAFFGANNENVARATYQMSQAMSSGVVKLMDWKSLENASMAGAALQEELVNTAATMSGMSVDAFKDYIGYSRGFRNTLEDNWLTADVFLETLRKFAGESREYWESLTASNGERLYSDEEIDRIMQLGEMAEEAATKVRTFKMMIDALSESIGSGWATTFRLLIGDLEQAKEFWTPINDLLTSIIGGVGDWRNSIVKSWADVYRSIAIDDLMTALSGVGDIFVAIGRGISNAFGSTHVIAGNIGRMTEAFGDLIYSLRLSDSELQDLSDLVEGLLSPFVLIGDVLYELTRTLFNAKDAMNEFDQRGDSLVDRLKPLRAAILHLAGAFGRMMSMGLEFVRENEWVIKSISKIGEVIKTVASIASNILGRAFSIMYALWTKYDMTNRVGEFCDSLINYGLNLGFVLLDLVDKIGEWIGSVQQTVFGITATFDPLRDLMTLISAVKQLFLDIVSPTTSISDAFNNFKEALGIGEAATKFHIWDAFGYIHDALLDLFDLIRDNPLGSAIVSLMEIRSAITKGILTGLGAIGAGFVKLIKIFKTGKISSYFSGITESITNLYNRLKDTSIGNVLVNIFGSIKNAIESAVEAFQNTNVGGAIFDFIERVKSAFETRFNLRRPNVITTVEDITENVRDVAEDIPNFKEANDKLDEVHKLAGRVENAIKALLPTQSSKNAAQSGLAIKDVLTAIEPIASSSGTILEKATQMSEAIGAVAAIDTDNANANIEKLAVVIAGFVGVFRYLLDSFLSIVAIISVFNFSKWSSVINTGLIAMSGAISGGIGAVASSITLLGQSIAAAFSAWGGAVKEQARAIEFKAVAEMFKTLAILIGIIFVGVALISQFGNAQSLADTLWAVLFPVMGLMTILLAMVPVFIGSVKKLAIGLKDSGVRATRLIISFTIFILAMSHLVNAIMKLVAVISIVSLVVSQLTSEQQDAFFKALNELGLMFIFVLGFITLISALFMKIGNASEMMDVSSIFGLKSVAAISVAASALTKIIFAISLLMAAMALSVAIMTQAGSNNAYVFEKAIDAIKGVLLGLGLIVGVVALLGAFAPQAAPVLSSASAVIFSLAGLFAVVGASVAVLALIFTTFGTAFVTSLNSLMVTMSGIEQANAYVQEVLKILNNAFIFFSILFGILTILEIALASNMNVISNIAASGAILAVGGAMLLIAQAFILIITGIVELASIEALLSGHTKDVIDVIKAISGLFKIIAVPLVAIAIFGRKSIKLIANLIALSGVMLAMAGAVAIIAGAISAIAAVGSVADITTAATQLLIMFGAISAIVGVLSFIGMAGNGFGSIALIAVAAVLIGVAKAVEILADAMLVASAAIAAYVSAMALAERLDSRKIVNNLTSLVNAIPELLGKLTSALPEAISIVYELSSALAKGLVDGFFAAIEFASATISANVAGVIELFGSIIVGIIVGVVLMVKDLIVELCRIPDGPLCEMLDILGPFLVYAGEWLGYYGFLLVTEFFQGILHAIYDLGWESYIIGGLSVIVASVKSWWAEHVTNWLSSKINDLVSAVQIYGQESLRNDLQDDIDTVQSQLDAVNAMMAGPLTQDSEGRLGYLQPGTGRFFTAESVERNRAALEAQLAQLNGELSAADDEYIRLVQLHDAIDAGLQEDLADTTQTYWDVNAIIQEQLAMERETLGLLNNAPGRTGTFQPGAGKYYDPSRYYALAAGINEASDSWSTWGHRADDATVSAGRASSSLTSIFSGLGQTLREAFGIGEGQSLMDLLGLNDMFGTGNGTGSSSSWFDQFSNAGETAADNLTTGLGDGISGYNIPTIDADNVISSDAADNLINALNAETNKAPEDGKMWTISPVLDATNFKQEALDLKGWWEDKIYDEVALDAGNSMLLREQAEADASTNGETSVSFTQNIFGETPLDVTRVYRDTRSILRAKGDFSFS